MKITSNVIENDFNFLVLFQNVSYYASKLVYRENMYCIDLFNGILFIGSINIACPEIDNTDSDYETSVLRIKGITNEKEIEIIKLLKQKKTVREIAKTLNVGNNLILKIKGMM